MTEETEDDALNAEEEEDQATNSDKKKDILSYYRMEGKGGAVFFTCINPDEPMGEF